MPPLSVPVGQRELTASLMVNARECGAAAVGERAADVHVVDRQRGARRDRHVPGRGDRIGAAGKRVTVGDRQAGDRLVLRQRHGSAAACADLHIGSLDSASCCCPAGSNRRRSRRSTSRRRCPSCMSCWLASSPARPECRRPLRCRALRAYRRRPGSRCRRCRCCCRARPRFRLGRTRRKGVCAKGHHRIGRVQREAGLGVDQQGSAGEVDAAGRARRPRGSGHGDDARLLQIPGVDVGLQDAASRLLVRAAHVQGAGGRVRCSADDRPAGVVQRARDRSDAFERSTGNIDGGRGQIAKAPR